MSFDPLTAAFDLGKIAIEKIWPDPTKAAIEIHKLEVLKQQGNLAELNAHVQSMLGQMKVNEAEANHRSVFVAGWRPFIGWVGGSALAMKFMILPIVEVLCDANGIDIVMPVISADELYPIILGMLGIGGFRTFEKTKNVNHR